MLRNKATYQHSEQPKTWNASEAARSLGVTPDAFHAFTCDPTFPRPTLDGGEPRWFITEVLAHKDNLIFRKKFAR